MKLARKIGKIFSADIFASLWENAARATHPVDQRKILAGIDQAALNQLRMSTADRPGARINRFEDATYWVGVNVKRAQDLWLDRSRPLKILDLGSGAGFFPYVCRLFGHDAVGFDLDRNPLFRGTTEILQVPRLIGTIEPNTPLPITDRRFDLITAYRVCFHRMGRTEGGAWREWEPSHWRFFFNDVRTRLLNPSGRLLLEFNPRPDGSSFFTRELRDCFEAEGGRIFRAKALFAADSKEKPRFKELE